MTRRAAPVPGAGASIHGALSIDTGTADATWHEVPGESGRQAMQPPLNHRLDPRMGAKRTIRFIPTLRTKVHNARNVELAVPETAGRISVKKQASSV